MEINRKIRSGIVVSDKMKKTIIVRITTTATDPFYGKIIKKHNKYKAHYETNSAKSGDHVKIIESRPLSKDKRWRLLEIIRKSSEKLT